MSFMSNYYAELKKLKKKEEEVDSKGSSVKNTSNASEGSFMEKYRSELSRIQEEEEDIAPALPVLTRATEKKEEEERKWFQKGLFEDGYDFGDISRTILGSTTDVLENVGAGILGMGEKALDAMAWAAPYVAQGQYYQNGGGFNMERDKMFQEQNEAAKKELDKFIAKDLYDEEKVAKKIILGTDENSVFGEKSDALLQSAGQLGATIGLQAVGVPWFVTSGVTSFGGETENAMKQGATREEAGLSAAITAGAEILTEKISGGIKFGGKALDDVLTKQIARGVSNKTIRTLAKLGLDAAGEGGEEILSGVMSAIGQKITYADDAELTELFSSEDALESFIGGAALGGGFGGINAIKSNAKGVDYVTELTANEQKVVDKVYKDTIAELEKTGKVTDKAKVYDEVLDQLEKGYISTDTIEEVLGDRNAYDSLVKESEEYKTLYETESGKLSERQKDRLAELKEKNKVNPYDSALQTAKGQLSQDVFNLVKGDRLVESYNEKARRGQLFEADISQYDEKTQATIQNAINSGTLNNTRRSHELVDFIAKISADKGVLFDFTNNEKIKGTQFAVEGKTVNGYVTDSGITLNVNSPKYLEATVGHEITHVLEGNKELYKTLQDTIFDYAKSKGEYDSRMADLTEQYKNIKGADIKKELTADLVGDYLFRDTNYIYRLSTENRNIFQKIYDEIKYLCRVATAGSKEARELEKVRKAFEDAYRGNGKAESGKKYSISNSNIKDVSTGYAYDETYFTMSYEQDGKVVATLEYGEYDGNPNVKMIEVDPEYRRKGIATKLLQELQKKYPDTEIDFGMTTDDGTKLLDSITYDVTDEAVVADREKLKSLQAELEDLQAKLDVLYDTDPLTEEQDAELHRLGDRWQEVYETIHELSKNLRGKKATRTFVKTDAKYSLSDSDGKQLTKEQQEYFKDSKIRDTDGNLLKVYHTTNNDFTVFDKAKLGEATGDSNTYMGFFFSDDAEYLQNFPVFQNGKTDAYYLNIKNPIDMTDISKDAFMDIVEVLGGDVDTAADVYEEVKLDNGGAPVHLIHMLQETGADATYADLIEELKPHYAELMSKGYDGVINYLSEYREIKEYIVLDSNQAKLTSNSKPTGDADIRYSVSDSNGRQLTDEQVAFFSDSKIRDADGNLKIMHHGSNEAFTVFDKKKAKASGYYGRGFYFTDSESHARQYGNTYDVYLNITNPLQDGTNDITKDQLRKFVEAIAENEDYGIENYGYGATVDSVTNSVYGKSDFAMLMDINAGCVGNMVEAIELFNEVNGTDYNGIVAATETVAFYPEQIKSVDNKAPTSDPDIRFSLSNIGETPRRYGTFGTRGEDVAYAPIAEEAPVSQTAAQTKTPVSQTKPEYIAPAEESYSDLLAKKEELESRMMEAAGAEDFDSFDQINAEYAEVMARIDEMEQYDQERVDILDDAEAPPEMEAPYQEREVTTLTQKATADIVRNVRTSLGLDNMQMADARNIIERYRTGEIRGRGQLISELQSKFGRYTEKGRDEQIAEAQAFLKTIKVYVPDHVKRGIADFNKVRQSNFGKIRFSKEGAGIDQVYQDELRENYPEYFPAEYDTEEDQLRRMIEVANWDVNTETERTLDIGAIEEAADAIIHGITEFRRNQDLNLSEREARAGFKSLLQEADQYAPAEDIGPTKATPAAEKPVAEEKPKTTRKVLHESILNDVKAQFTAKGFDFDRVLKRAKNLSTFATVDNTPQRVMEKALGYKEGGILADITVNKVAQNETDGIKWLNSYTGKDGLLRQISKQYGIKPGSKESAAAQMYAEGFYVDDANEIIQYGDAELAADFPNESVRRNIKRLAGDPRIRKIYDDTLAMINESRTRNAYPEIPRLDNYFLHFRAMEDTFSKLGLPFNPNDIRAKDLPTDLNGVTADLKPGQPYFASAMHRTGKRTSFDLLGGLEKYLSSAKNQIYHIDDIQTLRALRNYIADTYGQANGLEGLDALSEEEQQERIEKVYNSHLSTFAKFLNEEANVIAGKTALIDRGLEGIIGRRGITFLNTVNGQVGKNMVGFNLSSSLTNFLPVAQTFAKTNKFDFVKAFGQTVANKVGSIFGRNDGFADNSPVIIRRKGAESFYRTPYQKVGDVGYVFMSAVDDISTELITRTKYNELTRKGMDSQQAHFETDKWVSRLMGDRSLGQQPQLYNSKMLGLITKFQLEVRNQLDSQFYDTIQETKISNEKIQNELLRNAKTAAKVTSTFVQLAVVQHLFGKAFESVAGYNPAFDIIEVLMTACGWDDEEESEDTTLDNIEQGFLALLEDLPYAGTFTGGRIPISSALPVGQLIKGVDEYGNEKSRWETLGEVAPYYVLPGGYGQIKKTSAGLGMFSEDHPIAGSYTDSGNLRFPVEDTLGNRIQAGIFGQYASDVARDYFDNERKALNEKQTQEYIELDMPIRDYWDYREGLKKQETLEDKFDYIAGLDASVEQKNIMINNVVDRKEKVDMENYDDFANYEEFDWYTKNTEKYEFLQKHGISYKDYKSDDDTKDYYDSAYEWYNNNPEKVTVSEVISKDFMAYYKYKTDISQFDAKDENGESVSGLKKERVTNYINGLDLDYGQKLILFKSYYDSKADKEECVYGIVEYLNGRDDVSYEEMVTILEEIGYKVDYQGNIYWD